MAIYPGYRKFVNGVYGSRLPHWKVGKLTPAQRGEIRDRRLAGEDPKDLALEYGISASYVRQLAPLG